MKDLMKGRWDGKWSKTTPAWYPSTAGDVPDRTHYMGIVCLKNPLDAWAYQELIYENQPDVIIETGTMAGGSALFLSHCMINAGISNPLVITIDNEDKSQSVLSDNINKILGLSSDPEVIQTVEELLYLRGPCSVMVILDSDHSEENVMEELAIYSPFVTTGQYLVVEDGDAVPGPWKAVQNWLPSAPDFERTARYEDKLVWTSNPGGWLIRARGPEQFLAQRSHVPSQGQTLDQPEQHKPDQSEPEAEPH